MAPPPRCREVMRPWVLRPPDLVRPSVSDFSELERVTSARSDHDENRRPGEVGLCFLTATTYSPINPARHRIPPALDRTIAICLAKDAEQRWSSAHDVVLQLNLIANSEVAVR